MIDGRDGDSGARQFDLSGKRVWVAGHRGMVGSALCRRLERELCTVLTVSRSEVDLTQQRETAAWLRDARPDLVYVAAARVGGILANAARPSDFLYDNLMIAANVLWAARDTGVGKLVYLASSCIYPKHAPQPMSEEALLTGPLEPTNEAYAIAKIAGLKLAEAYNREHGCCFVTAMPPNLYGPNDNFRDDTSHVIPALIRRIDEAARACRESVTIWGTGRPRREFLHVDDLADACVFLARRYSLPGHINVGPGVETSIAGLAALIAEIVGYRGQLVFDVTKPDGAPRKLLDCTRIGAMGWTPSIALRDGIADAYRAWRDHRSGAAPVARSRAAG